MWWVVENVYLREFETKRFRLVTLSAQKRWVLIEEGRSTMLRDREVR